MSPSQEPPDAPAPSAEADAGGMKFLLAGAVLFLAMLVAAYFLSRDLDQRIAIGKVREQQGELDGKKPAFSEPPAPPKPEALRRFMWFATPAYVAFLVAGVWGWRRLHGHLSTLRDQAPE